MLALALVVSSGLNGILLLTILKSQRKVSLIMTANKEALDGLETDVTNESSAVDAAIVLINGLSNRLTDILTQTPAEDLTTQIQALRDEINQRSVALAQAVATGTAAENDSSNFPTTPGASNTSGQSTGTTSSDTSNTSPTGTDSSAPASSDSTSSSDTSGSGTSGDTSSGASAPSDPAPLGDGETQLAAGGDAPSTATDTTTPVAPAGDGTADVAPPSAGDNLDTTSPDSPAPVETPGDEAVAPDTGTALPDDTTTTPAP